jgi:hypothetical protein
MWMYSNLAMLLWREKESSSLKAVRIAADSFCMSDRSSARVCVDKE